ncbi:MAG: sigma-70 family RNA polymerase sigma factor [Acidisphaera sp.]|nr:sigma-70 family RNA polymerase sigma factor [Acidisphaera sp.]
MNAPCEARSHAALIVAIAQHRDRDAFARVFEHFAPLVKAYLQRTGSSPALAEETAQETMLAVWRKAGLYDPSRAGAAAWVFAIARNLRIDALRRTRVAPPEPDPVDAPAPPPLADALLAARRRALRLRAAIAALPPEQSQALHLAFFEERTHGEIEAALGVPLGTVKSRLRLAITRLRGMLKDDP